MNDHILPMVKNSSSDGIFWNDNVHLQRAQVDTTWCELKHLSFIRSIFQLKLIQ